MNSEIELFRKWNFFQKLLWFAGSVFFWRFAVYTSLGSELAGLAFVAWALLLITINSEVTKVVLCIGGLVLAVRRLAILGTGISIQRESVPFLMSSISVTFIVALMYSVFLVIVNSLRIPKSSAEMRSASVVSLDYDRDPDTKPCTSCGRRLTESKMDAFESEWYCRPCYLQLRGIRVR